MSNRKAWCIIWWGLSLIATLLDAVIYAEHLRLFLHCILHGCESVWLSTYVPISIVYYLCWYIFTTLYYFKIYFFICLQHACELQNHKICSNLKDCSWDFRSCAGKWHAQWLRILFVWKVKQKQKVKDELFHIHTPKHNQISTAHTRKLTKRVKNITVSYTQIHRKIHSKLTNAYEHGTSAYTCIHIQALFFIYRHTTHKLTENKILGGFGINLIESIGITVWLAQIKCIFSRVRNRYTLRCKNSLFHQFLKIKR